MPGRICSFLTAATLIFSLAGCGTATVAQSGSSVSSLSGGWWIGGWSSANGASGPLRFTFHDDNSGILRVGTRGGSPGVTDYNKDLRFSAKKVGDQILVEVLDSPWRFTLRWTGKDRLEGKVRGGGREFNVDYLLKTR